MEEAAQFRILGPVEVCHKGRRIEVPGEGVRALLAVLLLHAGEVVSTDRLAEELWGEAAPRGVSAALRVRVSRLRSALPSGSELVVTHPPGYEIRLHPDQLDLHRFEGLMEDGQQALGSSDPALASRLVHEALDLWRGPALADFAYAEFAQAAIARLEELRMAAVELRVEAELALGYHARLVGELQTLAGAHPLRERLWTLLMIALYRDGRQADALAAYQAARRRLVDEIGIEPGPELRDVEQRILRHDEGLMLERSEFKPARAILVVPSRESALVPLLALGEPLAIGAGHELIIALLTSDPERLAEAATRLQGVRSSAVGREASARVAAFTSTDRGLDAVRLAAEHDVSLLLLDAPDSLVATGRLQNEVATTLARAVCDVGLLAGADRMATHPPPDRPIVVPFAGHEHDWAAVELGAWVGRAQGRPLRLLGTRAQPGAGRRDASRLLGAASLALQRALGVAAEPILVAPGSDGIIEQADDAAIVVAGLSGRWRREGLGSARMEIATRAAVPVLFVRRGVRPGGLAPAAALTRFTWSGVSD